VFLVPMGRPGITVRPVAAMIGAHHLNEVFFDDVEVDDSEILGHADQGWKVVRFVLSHERVGIARYARSERILQLLADHLHTDAHRQEHARLLVKARTARLLNYRSVARSATDGVPAGVSVARIASTLLDQEVAALALEVLGEDGLSTEPDASAGGWIESAWRYARASTIASGTTEIQRMLVAKRMTEGT
jgi:alkylation response protein AidB-like acyl-CoA dehydrogenase